MRSSGAGGRGDDDPPRKATGLEARLADALVTRLMESRFSEALMEQVLAALTESRDLERLVVHLLRQPKVNGAVDGLVDREVERVLRELPRNEAVRGLVREQADAYLQHVAAHPEIVEKLVRDQVDRYLQYLTAHPEPVRQLIQDQSRGMRRDVQAMARARAVVADDLVDGWLGRTRAQGDERYAGLVSRGIGRALDVALLAALVAGGAWFVQQLFGIDPGNCARDAAWWHVRAQVCLAFPYVVPVAGLILPPLYDLAFFVATGQTPGMGFLGLRLRRADGRRVRLQQALKRVAAFYVTAGLGSFLVPFTARRRALQDMLGGTVVLRDWGDRARDVERAIEQVRSADA